MHAALLARTPRRPARSLSPCGRRPACLCLRPCSCARAASRGPPCSCTHPCRCCPCPPVHPACRHGGVEARAWPVPEVSQGAAELVRRRRRCWPQRGCACTASQLMSCHAPSDARHSPCCSIAQPISFDNPAFTSPYNRMPNGRVRSLAAGHGAAGACGGAKNGGRSPVTPQHRPTMARHAPSHKRVILLPASSTPAGLCAPADLRPQGRPRRQPPHLHARRLRGDAVYVRGGAPPRPVLLRALVDLHG